MSQQRKLAAIMFTDLVGYVALSQRNEALALELLKEHQELLRPLFSQHHGTEIKTIGDAFLVEFASAVEAARCAVDIQKALTAHTSVVTPERRIQVRIGLHIGDVVFEGDDVLGDGVNIASRLEPLAEPGGICLSEDVAHQIENKIGLPLELLGEKELKGIKKPVTVYRIVMPWEKQAGFLRLARVALRKPATARWAQAGALVLLIAAGMIWWRSSQRVPSISPGQITRLAVLPFANLMNDPDQEYFVDGMHDALLTELSKLGALTVLSRQSVLRYKGSDKPLREIARKLQVHALIEGSILRDGDDVRINVQLIEASSEGHLWADIFDRKLENILALHSDVARAIAREIKATLTPEEEARLASGRPVNPEAYETYLKGMYHLNKFTPEGFEKGLAYLNEAIEKDPNDPLPYAGLAIGYSMIAHGPSPPPGSYDRAEKAANKALAMDPNMAQVAEVYASLAQIKLYQNWDWTGAEQDFNLALELKPNQAETRIHYGWYLVLMGRSKEAIVEMKRAQQSDPLLPILPAFLGWVYWSYGRYDEALEEAQRALEINSNFPVALYVLGLVYSAMGRYDESIEAHKKAGAVHPDWGWGLGHTYALAGQREEALKVAEALNATDNNWNTWGLAEIYATLGEIDEAMHWIEKAYQTRHGYTPWIRWNPVFAPLFDDRRFQEVHQRLNLPG